MNFTSPKSNYFSTSHDSLSFSNHEGSENKNYPNPLDLSFPSTLHFKYTTERVRNMTGINVKRSDFVPLLFFNSHFIQNTLLSSCSNQNPLILQGIIKPLDEIGFIPKDDRKFWSHHSVSSEFFYK